MVEWAGSVNVPLTAVPFGCLVPVFDSYLFMLIVKTVAPVALVIVLRFAANLFQVRYGRQSSSAELLNDLWLCVVGNSTRAP